MTSNQIISPAALRLAHRNTGYVALKLAAEEIERLQALMQPVETTTRQPDGYAYRRRWPTRTGETYIAFDHGGEINGRKPVETVPYWLGPALPTEFPKSAVDCDHANAIFKCAGCGIDLVGENRGHPERNAVEPSAVRNDGPLCPNCGQKIFSIPRMGISHVCGGTTLTPEKAGCALCAEGMNSFADPATGNRMHARNGVVTVCTAQNGDGKQT
jgi:DNA-directed RNA polymerase subunit RPC12/RpoP